MFDGRQRGSLSAVTKGSDMIRKALSVLIPAGMTLLIASMWTDIVRYWKIRQLSLRGSHPQNVPASGRTLYPQRPGSGEADGTGDFDSASRGGPARVVGLSDSAAERISSRSPGQPDAPGLARRSGRPEDENPRSHDCSREPR